MSRVNIRHRLAVESVPPLPRVGYPLGYSLRRMITAGEARKVGRRTALDANEQCQSCGVHGRYDLFHWHERWHFSRSTGTQRLVGTIALCPACHQVAHYLTVVARKQAEEAASAKIHFMRVECLSESEADERIEEAIDLLAWRNEIIWRIDATWLIDFVELSAATQDKIRALFRQ